MALFKGTVDDFSGDYRQRYKNLSRQYGTATVSRDTLFQVFDDVAHDELTKEGFTKIKKGWYVRPSEKCNDIFQCLRWQEFRGGIAGLTWGVSLTFVPENPGSLNSEKIKWKRTLKSAQMDIAIGINHEIILNGEAPGQFDELNPPTFHGEKAYVRFTKTSWTLLKPMALRYLEELNSVQALIDYINLMREQPISNQWHHWDLPKAFCLAKLGKIVEARKLIRNYFEPWKADAKFYESAELREKKLLIALDDVMKPA